ncbi:Nif3-like dinuclear metal center hexameric protein [Mariniblastus fucicola]|uniref:GTP cyclohydrolase 1 type 2 homolog n=1 Tax=Mariniblastus fucicola TaxID=980251 RepID=A0A5B9PH15_9BACT|nr:Nif3-like dinuclear metal center hexameric protein [Mariniblastus fucicola]QEG24062.1 Putative GTP cyclohydrolase 1 type 2 [Mariniblastus fucicola]
MNTIASICDFLDQFAPTSLAEDWDNVGLILGDPNREAARVMTCLTVTPESATEAIEKKADLIVSHHPLPFSPTKRITTDQTATRLIWELAGAGVSIHSPHTGFDSANEGINQMLCDRLSIAATRPIVPNRNDPEMPGAGRIGKLPASTSLREFALTVKELFALPRIQVVGDLDASIQRVASACGSGGSFLSGAASRGAECLVTGEATFHSVLEARARKVGLILMGHYFSERFAIEVLSDKLSEAFPEATVWASEQECDPIESL